VAKGIKEGGRVLTVCGTIAAVAYVASPLGLVSSLAVGGLYGAGYVSKTVTNWFKKNPRK